MNSSTTGATGNSSSTTSYGDKSAVTPSSAGGSTTASTSAVRDSLASTGATIKEEASKKAAELSDTARVYAGQAGDKAKDAASKGKTLAADGLTSMSKAFSDVAPQVEERFGATYGDYARRASAKIDQAATALNEKSVEELAESARETVRKNPAIAVGAAAVVGYMLSKLFSSSNSRY